MCQRFRQSIPQAVAKTEQSTGDPMDGIEMTPSATEKPQLLHTHDQPAANYVRLMIKAGMNLPMGEERVTPLITEV